MVLNNVMVLQKLRYGSFHILKSLRTLYCITVSKYKATPPARYLRAKFLFHIVNDMKGFQTGFRDYNTHQLLC